MRPREIVPGVHWVGAIDWDRRLFDSLIPLPDGTTYNAYMVQGTERTVLMDSVDPTKTELLLEQIAGLGKIDYVIAHHAEQDHSGSIPDVLARHPDAKVLCTPKAVPMLGDLLGLTAEQCQPVTDGETLDLGGKTLKFLHTPWVHWPETMSTWLAEDQILFSCDFFGSHLATSELTANWEWLNRPSKRYYGEIMMPFAPMVAKNIVKVREYAPRLIAPSHGPIVAEPEAAMDAWEDWAAGPPRNVALLLYVSMHGSTMRMVEHLTGELINEGVGVRRFDLVHSDLGEVATALVDAATVILGTPTVLTRPHPLVACNALVANALKPKAKFATVIGSYGWGGKAVETVASLLSDLKLELLEPVLCQGQPEGCDLDSLSALAKLVARKHRELGLADA